MKRCCAICQDEYDDKDRRNRGGLLIHCSACAEEKVVKFTGNMIYDHKTGCSIQINKDPALTHYINKSTELKNKGSNLANNLKVSGLTKGEGRCLVTVGNSNAKGKLI